jgi:hypothetical protein
MLVQAASHAYITQVFPVCMHVWHTVSMNRTELKAIATAYHRAQKTADERRAALFTAIRQAAGQDDPIRQVDIVEDTGFTRDYVYRIVNPEAAARKRKTKRS